MGNNDSAEIAPIGIGWFNREDYPRILEIMVDAEIMPPTHGLWRDAAEAQEMRAKDSGLRVIRVRIEPDQFLAWCADAGLPANAQARMAYASEVAAKRMRP